MSINFLAGGGDYDQEPMYVVALRKRITELEAKVAELEAALAESCDDMRDEFLRQCPVAIKYADRIKELEAELEETEGALALSIDETQAALKGDK